MLRLRPPAAAQQEEVAVGILLKAEDGSQHAAGGIVDGSQQHEPRAAVLEPGVVAAVHLDEEPRLGHALPAATMARGTAGTGGCRSRPCGAGGGR